MIHAPCVKRVIFQAEIADGVAVANVLDYLTHRLYITRHFPALHHAAQIIAENATEIMMPRIREKRTAVGQHTHKGGQMSRSGQILQMSLHADLIIQEPPSRTVLDLSSRLTPLEATDESHDLRVHFGVEVEHDGLRKGILALQAIKEPRERRDAIGVGNTVVARVSPQLCKHLGVVVAHCADVQFGCDVVLGVKLHQGVGEVALEAICILGGNGLAAQRLLEDGVCRLKG